jgi:glucose-1-phosphate cytidylyltransferase
MAISVVILCGGKGTRSYPYTDLFPKPLMPIGGRPIIVYLMETYAAQGFHEFVLAAGHKKEVLADYFEGRFPKWKVRIVDTGDSSETGERIRRCSPYLGERFMATYGDGLGDVDLAELLQSHVDSGALATLTTVPLRSQYGVVRIDGCGRVSRFDEKPTIRDHWINGGFFVFEKAVFNSWHGCSLESEVLTNLANRGQLNAYRHEGFWKSMDTSKDQQELEALLSKGAAPWAILPAQTAVAS